MRPGATTSTFLENRASCGWAALFRICQAMTIAMTTVLPDPVAILEQRRSKLPPSEGTSMPALSDSGASVSQISVSAASNWQKKNRRFPNSSGSLQYSSSRLVTLVTPG